MSVFISWSGASSKIVAHAFSELLRNVLQGVRAFYSVADIRSGAVWFQQLREGLEEAHFGVIAATHQSIHSPWVMFEAGAIWKARNGTAVAALLIDVTEEDLARSPLQQFQAKHATKDSVTELLRDIRNAIGHKVEEDVFQRAVDANWEAFDTAISEALAVAVPTPPAGEAELPAISQGDEILERIASMERYLANQAAQRDMALPRLESPSLARRGLFGSNWATFTEANEQRELRLALAAALERMRKDEEEGAGDNEKDKDEKR